MFPRSPPLRLYRGPSSISQKKTTASYEVLNPSTPSSSAPTAAAPDPEDDDDDDDEPLPALTPSLQAFSELPLWAFQTSFEFIQSHRDVVVPGAQDALLVAGFRAQSEGKFKYAKQCVHQSKLLQYCESLGGDGVRVFFKRMMTGAAQAQAVFTKDVEDTYALLSQRVKISKEEEAAAAGGQEQIQLVAEDANTEISFNVPDGPPPENLILEGPGTEGLDVDEVRKALQMRWDVFNSFKEELKAALREGTLEGVNKVLGGMKVDEAEEVVRLLDAGGILSFAEGGIRDETGQGEADDEEDVGGKGKAKA